MTSKIELAYREGYGDAVPQIRDASPQEIDKAWEISHAKEFLEDPKLQPLSDEDKRSIKYFILDKGDVTRWVQWEEKKDQVFAEFPELERTLRELKAAETRLDTVAEENRIP